MNITGNIKKIKKSISQIEDEILELEGYKLNFEELIRQRNTLQDFEKTVRNSLDTFVKEVVKADMIVPMWVYEIIELSDWLRERNFTKK